MPQVYQLKVALDDRAGIDLDAAARRVVLDAVELGYVPDLHANFDRHILATYGGGRGKPAWIERIGKKYQWIALNRLIGTVTDHIPKTLLDWDPPLPAVPGPQSDRLRHLDPTIVDEMATPLPARRWVPAYDWGAVTQKTDPDWVADDTDLPSIEVDTATSEQRPHIVLSGSYQWTAAENVSDRSRQIWTTLTPLLVKTVDLATAIDELNEKDLGGESITRQPMFLHGFVAEYPFGHHYGEELHVYEHEMRQPLTVATWHAAYDLLGEYEYAPDELGRVSLDGPAPEMFGDEPGRLRWNGKNGWLDKDGESVAAARHVRGSQQNELLMDKAWLEHWLVHEDMSLIWIEVTGKDAYTRSHRSHPGRLIRTAVRHWTPGGSPQSAPPGYYGAAARTEEEATSSGDAS